MNYILILYFLIFIRVRFKTIVSNFWLRFIILNFCLDRVFCPNLTLISFSNYMLRYIKILNGDI
ncbi:hypothetical protein LMANV2_350030 [Leptospira interrogans serovar Manilae]|uniref:Uncharacterized protein n=1 Tax=Leptospira interrogans serovar Manilae TaxID=214675 RepID=A0AAQ1NZW7_LEPIR|nr:hypothetical protein LMANV2_350030 [Leptospira interrogans serovar Manilae]